MALGLGFNLGLSKTSGVPLAVFTATPLGSLVSSCVFDLDATLSSSYDGSSQTWLNIETTPADGAAQADHNFYLGNSSSVTTSDPAFVGSSGFPSAYFEHDGGDYFRNVAASAAAQPAFYKNLHKSTGGQAHSIVLVGQFPATGGTTRAFAGTGGISVGFHGIDYYAPGITQIDKAGIGWYDATGANTFINSPVTSDGTNKIVIFTFDPSSGAYKVYVNQASSPTTGTLGAQTSTTDATNIFEIMAGGGGVLPAGNGARLYACSMYNAVLSDANVATIVSEYNNRHGRVYV